MATAKEREEAAVRAAQRRSEHLAQEKIRRLEDQVAGLETSLRHDRALFEEVAGALRRAIDALDQYGGYPGVVQAAQETLGGAECSLSALPLEKK